MFVQRITATVLCTVLYPFELHPFLLSTINMHRYHTMEVTYSIPIAKSTYTRPKTNNLDVERTTVLREKRTGIVSMTKHVNKQQFTIVTVHTN